MCLSAELWLLLRHVNSFYPEWLKSRNNMRGDCLTYYQNIFQPGEIWKRSTGWQYWPHIQSQVPGVNPPHSNMCIFPESGSQLRTFQEYTTLLCSWESIVEITGNLHFFLSTYLTQIHHEPSDIPRIARTILQSCTTHYWWNINILLGFIIIFGIDFLIVRFWSELLKYFYIAYAIAMKLYTIIMLSKFNV